MSKSPLKPRHGKAALDQLYRGVTHGGRPLLMLDFDDVICLQKPYGGYDVFQPPSERPADLWEKLWHQPALHTLRTVLAEHQPQVVLTTSWLRLLDHQGFLDLFRLTDLQALADALHPAWEAPPLRMQSRWQAIERWLFAHYEGQPLAVLDDAYSGTGLAGSRLHRCGRVVLCEVGVGLHEGLLPAVRHALRG